MNIHIVAPHGVVFEIRIAEGYGARWSKDGNKVSLSYKTFFLSIDLGVIDTCQLSLFLVMLQFFEERNAGNNE